MSSLGATYLRILISSSSNFKGLEASRGLTTSRVDNALRSNFKWTNSLQQRGRPAFAGPPQESFAPTAEWRRLALSGLLSCKPYASSIKRPVAPLASQGPRTLTTPSGCRRPRRTLARTHTSGGAGGGRKRSRSCCSIHRHLQEIARGSARRRSRCAVLWPWPPHRRQ